MHGLLGIPPKHSHQDRPGLSVALRYMNYNFCRIHKTLRVTPAMAAGVTDHLWGIGDIVLEDWEVADE